MRIIFALLAAGLLFCSPAIAQDTNDQQLFAEYKHAAEQGDATAQFKVGVMYAQGMGVAKDGQQAIAWYKKAAEQGHADAQAILSLYAQSESVPQDAVIECKKAAEQGDATAQLNLAMMYDKGIGVAKDEQQAVVWYKKAAEQGHADAQYILGDTYFFGLLGVQKDYVMAYMWLDLAATQKQEYATERDETATEMTAAQLEEAQRLARDWKPTKAP